MAKSKTRGEGSKAIRAYVGKNPDASAQQVMEGLKVEGITVGRTLAYNVLAGMRKKTTKKPATTKNAAASANGAAGVTKADQIREVAKGMTKPVRPMDVRAALAAKGVDVSYTQVGQVLSSMGMKRKRRRRKAAAGTAAPAARTTSASLSIDDLVAAKKLVAQVGSIEKVKEALSALARLS